MMGKNGLKVSLINVILNVFLALLKFMAGIFGKSRAMLSDSLHSLADVFSTFIVIIGIKMSSRNSNEKYQYGHERLENVASILLAFTLLMTGIFIGYKGIGNLVQHNFLVPNKIALFAALLSIVIKELMYWYTIRVGKRVNSAALKADAWHHQSDALASVGSLIGIVGSMNGLIYLDLIAALLTAIIIVKVSIDIFLESIAKMLDKSCDENIIRQIEDLVISIDGVLGIDLIKSRLFGNKFYVDLEITANKDLSLENAHEIAHQVHDKVEEKISSVKHCMVHVNPK